MSIRNAVRAAVLASWSVLAACSSSPTVPAGQSFAVTTTAFGGGLKDLASQVTIDAVLKHPGAKLAGSIPYPDCPALAGLQTYHLKDGTILELAFSVHGESAVTATYTRPASAPEDAGIVAAMKRAVCQV